MMTNIPEDGFEDAIELEETENMQDIPLMSPMGKDALIYHLDDINDVDLSMNANSEELSGQKQKSIHKEEKDNILLFYVELGQVFKCRIRFC